MTVLYNGTPRTGEVGVDSTAAFAAVSQKFVGGGSALVSIKLSMRHNGAPVGFGIPCNIYASDVNGLPTGASLAVSTNVISDSDLLVTHADYTYTFSGFTPANGTPYCVAINYDSLGFGSEVFAGTIAAGSDGGTLTSSTWSELGTNLYGTVTDAALPGPTITVQPQDANNNVGDTATFSVTATASSGSLTYQWQEAIDVAFVNIGGATSSSYTTGANVQSSSGINKRYQCVVTDSNGSVTTTIATLFVSAGPLLALQIGGAPVSEDLTFATATVENTYIINLGGAPGGYDQTFTAQAAEGEWSFMLGMAAMPALAASGISAALSITEANDTLTSTTTVLVSAASTVTDGDTLLSAATVLVSASAALTENDSLTSAATVLVTASASIAEGNDSLLSTTTILVSAALSVTEANDSLLAAAVLPIVAAASIAEANDTLLASGTIALTAALAVAEGDDTVLAAGAILVTAVVGVTEDPDTLLAAGTVSSGTQAALSVTEDPDTIVAAGTISLTAQASVVEADDLVTSAATVLVQASVGRVEDDDTIIATGTVFTPSDTNCAVDVTEQDDTIIARGIIDQPTPPQPQQDIQHAPFGGGGKPKPIYRWWERSERPVIEVPRRIYVEVSGRADVREENDSLVATAIVTGRSRRKRDEELLELT